jgi:hypothetical protein
MGGRIAGPDRSRNMTRSTFPTALALVFLVALSAPPARADEPDAAVKAQLDSLDIKYKVDGDGDFEIVYDLDGGRTQRVWIRSATDEYGSLKVREIWSPGYKLNGAPLPPKVAARLLESSHDLILGGWTAQKEFAMLVVKIPASATPKQLQDAAEFAANVADKLEKEFTQAKDEL